MITDLIIDLFYYLGVGISLAVSWAGDVPANNDFVSGILTIRDYYIALSDIFPMVVILAIVAFVAGFEIVYGTYKLIRWAYNKIPGVN